MRPFSVICVLLASVMFLPEQCRAQDDTSGADDNRRIGVHTADSGFSGPASTQSQLEEDDILRDPVFRFPAADEFFGPWHARKQRIGQDHGLAFGVDYNMLSQGLSDSLGDEDGGTVGVLRGYGVWTLFESGEIDYGRLTFKVDHRHKVFSDVAPASLAGEAGYVGVTGTLFSDIGLVLVDFNWQQTFNDGRSGLIVGRFDPNDYMGVLGYANPWTAFSNLATLLNPSVAFPDAMLGFGGGHRLSDQWYVKGSINDANGVVTETKAFSGGAEFFKWGEIGWTPSPDQQYLTNIHMVAWHVDEREKAGIDSAHGIMLGANRTTADQRWMGFLRAGWSKGSAPIYNETYTAGFIRKFRRNSDLLGLAVNWGDPPSAELASQVTGEFFYRLQFSQALAITPSVQLLKDPALNPEEDTVWVWGIRFRLAL